SEPPEEVQLAISAESSELLNEDFGPTAVKRVEGDRTLVTFDCTNPEFAASRVLAAKGGIQVLRGDKLRARIADELAAIDERYETDGGVA
ncbi:MAG TPA: WYL domain-containing protein, partial [Kofleriaceae bacterium]